MISLKKDLSKLRLMYISAIVLVLIAVLIQGYLVVRKNDSSLFLFNKSLAFVLFDSVDKMDIRGIKRTIRGFSESHQGVDFCVIVESIVITQQSELCQGEFDEFRVPLSNKKILINSIDTNLFTSLISAGGLSILFIFGLLYLFNFIVKVVFRFEMDLIHLITGGKFFYNELEETHLKLVEAHQLKENLVKVDAEFKLSRQIAHDIRSPLEALRSISDDLEGFDYSTRMILTSSLSRISSIANKLLLNSKHLDSDKKLINIRIILDDLIRDKEYEKDLKLNYSVSDNLYKGYFVFGEEEKIYRTFSNLINNALEACPNDTTVDIVLEEKKSNIIIKIIDSGNGMTAFEIEKALQGEYSTKSSGHGLGLSFSNSIIKEMNGELEISSELGVGTCINVKLKNESPPIWFEDTLTLPAEISELVCIDDDQSFLEVYRDKFKNINCKFSTYTETPKEHDFNLSNFYLIDYDIAGIKGLDIIKEYQLESRSFLVTSMFDNDELQTILEKEQIKLIPKQIFNKVSISYKDEIEATNILIDDDKIIHLLWTQKAKAHSKKIVCYKSVEDFLKFSSDYSKLSTIYIDSDLGDGKRGEIESEHIAKLGFQNIVLTTGYSPDDISLPLWIKSIVGKRPPF